jgi:hypothetical protein
MSRSFFAKNSPTRCAQRRYLAGAFVALAVVGQFATLAHLALVPHEVCPEHGEFIHTDANGNGFAQHFSQNLANSAALLQASESPSAAHGHEHCDVAAHRRESLVVRAYTSVVIWQSAQAITFALPDSQPRFVARGVIAYAPKASPPA